MIYIIIDYIFTLNMAFYSKPSTTTKLVKQQNIETFKNQKDILLIRKLLSYQEQITLCAAVFKAEMQCKNIKLINKNPNSQTILVISPKNSYQLKHRSSPIFNQLFEKTLNMINKIKIKTKIPTNIKKLKIDRIKGLEYDCIGGKIEPHCDCRKGYIMIFSLGHTANFYIKGANMIKKKEFECNNGDCLLFDTSKDADIIHCITSIKPNSYNRRLAEIYPRFRQSRICVMIGFQ